VRWCAGGEGGRAHVSTFSARVSSSRLRGMQYLKDASYNEFGEYEFVFERTIVPTKKKEN
jgi:hypothetical protein